MKKDKVKFTEKNNMKARKMILDSPLEVKAIKQFRGHDGDGYNCNIYWDGKKVGYANDFANGGELECEFYYGGKYVAKFCPIDELINSLPKGSWFEYNHTEPRYGASWNIDAMVNFLVFDKLNRKEMKKLVKNKCAVFNPKKGTIATWNIPPMNAHCVKYNFKEEKGITFKDFLKKYHPKNVLMNELEDIDAMMSYWYKAYPKSI